MSRSCVVLPLLFSAGLCAAASNPLASYNDGMRLSEPEAARLESVLASNPDDMDTRAQLLGYYTSQGARDAGWANRLRLLTWGIEHHPESAINGNPQIWWGMPDAIFQQLKPVWVGQVHQHADDYNVLRNAAAFLAFQNAPQVPGAIRVGGNVQASNLIKSVAPVYPPLALQARIQGTVRFNVTIGPDGHIQNMQLVSGHPLLVAAAQEALQQYQWKPTLLNGNPVQVSTTVDISFTLGGVQ
ncbi:MAG: TonB family protein [Bryobacterales bacterium]|nr:TonB family protein [Bryobacterales bacterium]